MNHKIKKTFMPFAAIVSACISLVACGPTSNPTSEPTIDPTEPSVEPSVEPVVAKNNNYTNPTYPVVNGKEEPTYMADPFVIRGDDGKFYQYCTQTDVFLSDDAPARSFVRGPIFESDNCVDWKYKGNVFENYEPTWGTSGAGVWAPTVCKVGDYYNFYYSLSTGGDSNPGIGVARSTTPYGPFEHFGKLFNSEEIGVTNSIDPYVFWDEGHLYIAWGSFGGLITIAELENDGLSLKGGLETQKEAKVAIAGYERNEVKNYEATIILKRNGYYYLFLSTGTCCSGAKSTYHVVCARSENLFGPYTDSKGKGMFGPDRGDHVVVPSLTGIMGPGHNGLVTDDNGDVWMIYHGYDVNGPRPDWRVTFLDKLIWDEETGMPHVADNKASMTEQPGPYISALEEN